MNAPLPPDRGHVTTEQRHAGSRALGAAETRAAISLMTEDHRSVPDAVERAGAALAPFIDDVVACLRGGGRLVYVGAGTSGRLGVLDASECPPTFQSDPGQVLGIIAGGDAALRRSSEAKEDDPAGALPVLDEHRVGAGDAVLGIAAGGTTPWVRGAVTECARRGAVSGLLTCAAGTTAPDGCGHLIILDTGPEVLTGSTRLKAGTATKLALNTITTVAFAQLGKIHGNLMIDLRATNAKLLDRAIRIVQAVRPEFDRAGAAALLHRADGAVRVALAMAELECDAVTAQAALAEHGQRLHELIDASRAPSG